MCTQGDAIAAGRAAGLLLGVLLGGVLLGVLTTPPVAGVLA